MKPGIRNYCQFVLMVTLVAPCAFGQGSADNVRVAVKDWERMWNSFDLLEVDRLFLAGDDLTYFSSEREGLLEGIDELREHYRSFGFVDGGNNPLTKLWLEDVDIKTYGSTAIVTGIWFFQRTDGRLQKGPVSIVYSEQNDHHKIAHMNFSNYDAEQLPSGFQAMSLLGKSLVSRAASPSSMEKLQSARAKYDQDPGSIDNVVWYGRRMAYTGDYRKAIAIYSDGIDTFPEEPRLYRHRGHRLISIREFDAAIQDLETALELIEGTEDVVEQDGLPNPANIPVSTLHSNIRYHLGLAYYLTDRLEEAVEVYQSDLDAGGSDDFVVASTHWLYMSLRRLGREQEAMQALSRITDDMTLYESQYYYELCLLYKGETDIDDMVSADSEGIAGPGRSYGVANWYSYNGDQAKANMLYRQMLEGEGWATFGYIAAEADLARQEFWPSSQSNDNAP